MKILYVNDNATLAGGAEIMMLALRDGMRARGHEARLFASSANPHGTQNLADDVCFGTTGRWRTALQSFNPSAYRQLKRVMKEFQPDVVHVALFLTQLSPWILPLLKRVPSLYHVVWYRAVCPRGTKLLPDLKPCQYPYGTACLSHGCVPARDWPVIMGQMKLWRRWANVFDQIVPVSNAVKAALTAEGIESAEPVPCGVPVRPMRQAMDDQPTAVFAGRLVKEKGVDVLLDAMAMVLKDLPTARLLIAGDGPEKNSLLDQTARLGIAGNVEFLGLLSSEEMEKRFDGAWVQVVCSRWAEPFGLVAVEAMMRGMAVIASNSGGLAEIVEHPNTGLLVPQGDAPALAEAMRNILADRSRAKAMGHAGHDVAMAKYRMDQFLDRLEQIYQQMVNHSRAAPEAAGT